MDEQTWLAERFEQHRAHLRAVAYRMLGSVADADEAVQETWLRVSGAGANGVDNFGGWLTTIVARICLNGLQARRVRVEKAPSLPDPIVTLDSTDEALELSDSVGLALQIVLETLPPAERLAFVLHDMFDVPFEEIAPMVGRSPTAARQLASRGRRRVRGASVPDADVDRQRQVVDAFFAAARAGDFDALVSVLHPDVVRRVDGKADDSRPLVRGAAEVARSAIAAAAQGGAVMHPARVNGAAGAIAVVDGRPFAVFGFIVAGGKIVEIDVVLGEERLARLDLASALVAPR